MSSTTSSSGFSPWTQPGGSRWLSCVISSCVARASRKLPAVQSCPRHLPTPLLRRTWMMCQCKLDPLCMMCPKWIHCRASSSRPSTRPALTRYSPRRWPMVSQRHPTLIRLVPTNIRIRFHLSLYLEVPCFHFPTRLASFRRLPCGPSVASSFRASKYPDQDAFGPKSKSTRSTLPAWLFPGHFLFTSHLYIFERTKEAL